MPLNIKRTGLFYTPKSVEDLQEMVGNLNSPDATLAMMWTWNYLAGVIEEYEESTNEKGNDDRRSSDTDSGLREQPQ